MRSGLSILAGLLGWKFIIGHVFFLRICGSEIDWFFCNCFLSNELSTRRGKVFWRAPFQPLELVFATRRETRGPWKYLIREMYPRGCYTADCQPLVGQPAFCCAEIVSITSAHLSFLSSYFWHGGYTVWFRPGWLVGFCILGTNGPKFSAPESAGQLPAGLHHSHGAAVALVVVRQSDHVPGRAADFHRPGGAFSRGGRMRRGREPLCGQTPGGDQAQGAPAGAPSSLQSAEARRQHPGEEEDAEHQLRFRGAALSRPDVPLREASVQDRHSETGHSLHRPPEGDPDVGLRPQILRRRMYEEWLQESNQRNLEYKRWVHIIWHLINDS